MLLRTSGKSSSWETHWQDILAVDSIWRLLFLLPHSPPVNRPTWRGSDSCVHAGELLKFPVCPLRKPPQFWLLELWVKMPCFSAYPHWLSRSLYLSSNFCFMSTWGLISIPYPSRFYQAIQVPVLFLRTSQALPHYPLYASWWSLTAWCETLHLVADAWQEWAPREKNGTQKLAAASHSLEHTGTLLVLVPRSRRAAHSWAQAFESVQWVSQMGMLRLWGWRCQYHRTWKMSVCYSKTWQHGKPPA